MEAEIKMIWDKEEVFKYFEIIIPRMQAIHNLKIVGCALILPATIWYLYDSYIKNKINAVLLCCFFLSVVLFWFCIHGCELAVLSSIQMILEKFELPAEYTLTFNEQEIKGSSINRMARLKCADIENVCENDTRWVFGNRLIFVDKRTLTEEQLAFLTEKSDAIKFHNRRLIF